MKAKDLKTILSKIEDNEEVLFMRYDHFLKEYECYDYIDKEKSKDILFLELVRKPEDDEKFLEDDNDPLVYTKLEREYNEQELLWDMNIQ